MTQLVGRAARKRLVCYECAVFGLLAVVTVTSAVLAKRFGDVAPALAAVDGTQPATESQVPPVAPPEGPALDFIAATIEPDAASAPEETVTRVGTWHDDAGVEYYTPEAGHVRYYNGRPIRPVRTVWMVTTAYSPDSRSCGKWADGKTASLKSVWTNAMSSVAADTSLLPFGTLLSVPGYSDGDVVPVLDRGGAIKGARLDLLHPTHKIARQWGVQRLPVTIWEYADEDAGAES